MLTTDAIAGRGLALAGWVANHIDPGMAAADENVYLLGGMGQGEFVLTKAVIVGMRTPTGLEIGMGPSVGYSQQNEAVTTSMIVAGGATLPMGGMYLPLTVAVALAEGGPRVTTLVGWIVG